MDGDLRNRNVANVNIVRYLRCIARSHLDQHAGTQDFPVNGCVLRGEEFLMAHPNKLLVL
jgi:hypothetical protein